MYALTISGIADIQETKIMLFLAEQLDARPIASINGAI